MWCRQDWSFPIHSWPPPPPPPRNREQWVWFRRSCCLKLSVISTRERQTDRHRDRQRASLEKTPKNTHTENTIWNHRIKSLLYKSGLVTSWIGGGDSSVVRAPDSWLKGRGFESLLERQGEFSSPGSTFCADSYFGIRSTPVLPQ